MEGFYDRCKELFDAGQRAEFIRYCRDSIGAGLMYDDDEFKRVANSPMGDWLLYDWDNQPQ